MKVPDGHTGYFTRFNTNGNEYTILPGRFLQNQELLTILSGKEQQS